MPNKMLIDASHPEETRVVVVRGNRIEEFDFESQDKKQLKGNIYLARVTRVEPSLQAAFVEYGGNRHGFLAFSEIHPDYYQIPVADRQALLRAEAEEQAADEESLNAEDDEDNNARGGRHRRSRRSSGQKPDSNGQDNGQADDSEAPPAKEVLATAEQPDSSISEANGHENGNGNGGSSEIESVGAEDAMEEVRERRKPVRRQYKIQEVIKRRQILLVQVVKEERGNKGAALTTYLSLAGRYSVLMPNTARGGGISRKITNPADRKRLKEIVKGLEVPDGMGVILRTAGQARTRAEVKRDYEYLMRLWDNVRELTLQSTAPTLVYEEGSLIKRSIRDLYNKDINQIKVAGEAGYREAKNFMRMLMPSHAKFVQPYRDNSPIFANNGIESQLDKMVQPQVTLKSGGYIIINQTEALVAIDVNSGRSTREHSIEDTALQTNLEAAEEVARQLRLRDLAGLIVIDFIDMEENRNNRAVEKRLKDCLKNDRARIQVGRISHFGLLEMSRQRIRASVLESTMQPCPHCGGTGHIRSESSVALLVMRAIEDFLLKDNRNHVTVRTPTSTALYILNHKRDNLTDMEARFGLSIGIEADDGVGSQHYAILKGAPVDNPVAIEPPVVPMVDEPAEAAETEINADQEVDETAGEDDSDQPRKRRRRRRRRGGTQEEAAAQGDDPDKTVSQDQATESNGTAESDGQDDDDASQDNGNRKRRRRGKRGGRRNRRDNEDAAAQQDADTAAEPSETGGEEAPVAADSGARVDDAAMAAVEEASTVEPVQAAAQEPAPDETTETPKSTGRGSRGGRRSKRTDVEPEVAAAESDLADGPGQDGKDESEPAKPARRSPRRSRKAETADVAETQTADQQSADPETAPAPGAEASASQPDNDDSADNAGATRQDAAEPVVVSDTAESDGEEEAKPRRGWWQRRSFF